METTMSELMDLFKVRCTRTIHKNLKGKIYYYHDKKIVIADNSLKYLLSEFRIYGVLTVKEACKKYGIEREALLHRVRRDKIPHFQIKNQPSQILFFPYQLENYFSFQKSLNEWEH